MPSLIKNNIQFRIFDSLREFRHSVLLGSPVCENSKISDSATELHDRSLCSWHWSLDFDPLRIPTVLRTAKCNCKEEIIDGIPFECHPIKYRLKAMRYLDANCDRLEPTEVEIGVACAAALITRMEGKANYVGDPVPIQIQ